MSIVQTIVLKIKRKDNRVYALLHDLYRAMRRIEVPVIRPLHALLYYERAARRAFIRNLVRLLYYEPLFKARCARVGRGCRLVQTMPLISGNLQIYLGDRVTIDGTNTFESTAVFDAPVLHIGTNTTIAYHVAISVAKEVTIGENCFIAKEVTIMDNDGHPLDPVKRAKHERVSPDDVKPVHIGNNVWIGSYAMILKGVSIGDGAIVGAHSLVIKDIPSHCIAAGNPAKVLRQLTHSEFSET